jgi:hypothetical protein
MGARFESRGGPYALTIDDPAILDAIATLPFHQKGGEIDYSLF